MGPAGAVLRQEPALSAILCNGVWRFVRSSGESANSRDVKFSLERTAAEGNSSGRCRHAPQWQRLRSSAVPDPVALKPHNSEADPSDTVLSCTEWNAMAAAKLHQERSQARLRRFTCSDWEREPTLLASASFRIFERDLHHFDEVDGDMVAMRCAVLHVGEEAENRLIDPTDNARFLKGFAFSRDATGFAFVYMPFGNAPSSVATTADKQDFNHPTVTLSVADGASLRDLAGRSGP